MDNTERFTNAMREIQRAQGQTYDKRRDWFLLGNVARAAHAKIADVPWLKPIDLDRFTEMVKEAFDGAPKGYDWHVWARYYNREVIEVVIWRGESTWTPGNQHVKLCRAKA